MTVVLVHGNPETDAVWGPLSSRLGRDDVVRLSPPGSGAPAATGGGRPTRSTAAGSSGSWRRSASRSTWSATTGAAATSRTSRCTRPDLLRSWCQDILGVFEPDYVWHDLAQVWQTPGRGEAAATAMISGTLQERAERLRRARHDARRSPRRWPPARPEWAAHLGALPLGGAARPGEAGPSTWTRRPPARDWRSRPRGPLTSARTRCAAGPPSVPAPAPRCSTGSGHWWMVQDPARGAAVLSQFWDSVT